MFADQVIAKDTEVQLRNGEKANHPALVVNVHNALKTAGANMQSASKTTILAIAASITSGRPMPVATPVPAPAPRLRRKPEPEKPAEPLKPLQSTSKPVVVSIARAGAPRPIVPERQVDADVIHRYQCAVASAQLLAALHQLFEKDDFPGHEQRKKKLDDLINDVEQASSTHVNLSVKAIIRAKTSTTIQATV